MSESAVVEMLDVSVKALREAINSLNNTVARMDRRIDALEGRKGVSALAQRLAQNNALSVLR